MTQASGKFINPKILGFQLLLGGMLFSGVGYYFYQDTTEFVSNGQSYEAVVSGYEDTEDTGCPLVGPWKTQYTVSDSSGKEWTVTDAQAHETKPYGEGDIVPIVYNPSNDKDPIREEDWNTLWGPSVYILLGGLVAMSIGALLATFGPNRNIWVNGLDDSHSFWHET